MNKKLLMYGVCLAPLAWASRPIPRKPLVKSPR